MPEKPTPKIPEAEPSEIYIETVDKTGAPITVFSTTGKLKTAAEFSKAIANYDEGKKPTEGFVTLPTDSMTGKIRTRFETVNQPIQEAAPKIGRAVGSVAAMSPLLMLLQKAGIVPPGTGSGVVSAAGDIGEGTARMAAEQVNTPGKAGMAVSTAAVSPFMLPASTLTKLPGIATGAINATLGGGAVALGSATGKGLTGEAVTPASAAVDFGVGALGGGLQSTISHFITKYINKGMQEKVAKGVVDTFKTRHPTLSAFDNVMDIAGSSADDISRLTQQMSKGLRESGEEIEKDLITRLNITLPSSLSVGQQNTLRGSIRRLTSAQNKQLDNIGTPEAFEEAGSLVTQRTQELLGEVRSMFPKVKNIDPAILRAEGILGEYNASLSKFQEGSLVLHYLKQSGASGKYDPVEFAQRIRGVYQNNSDSQLNAVGKILGQGRPLTQMPTPGEPDPIANMGRNAYNSLRDVIPGMSRFTNPLPAKLPQAPWVDKQPPLRPLINFGIQESGQKALQSFRSQETQ